MPKGRQEKKTLFERERENSVKTFFKWDQISTTFPIKKLKA
jgi:hypothetical protein